MIYILTQEDIVRVDHQTDWQEQLKVINNIRREIMQSSSGILPETRFQVIMKSISKVRQLTCFVVILSVGLAQIKSTKTIALNMSKQS